MQVLRFDVLLVFVFHRHALGNMAHDRSDLPGKTPYAALGCVTLNEFYQCLVGYLHVAGLEAVFFFLQRNQVPFGYFHFFFQGIP